MVDEKYQMKDGESIDDYMIRASALGQQNRLTWQEIADIINEETDLSFSESKYRKNYRTYCKGVEAGARSAEGESIVEEPVVSFTAEDFELRQRYQTATEKMPYYRLMRQDSRFERFYRLIADQIKQLPPPDYIAPIDYDGNDEEDMEYILGLADLHIGSCFDGVNNSYSIEEATRRFDVLLGYMINFIQKKHISKLKILSLGDTIQGILRLSDLRLNEGPVVDSFVVAVRLIADFLNKLSAYCRIEFLMVCYSNHDQLRPLGTKASELASEDMGKIMFAYLTDVLALNERIQIIGDTNRDSLEFDIWDFHCKAMHGHQINNPATVSKDLANRDRKFYDYVFLGHTHSAREIITAEGEHHNIQTLTLGSFIGSCPYADKLMVGSKASCSIYGFHKKYGHVESYTCILN